MIDYNNLLIFVDQLQLVAPNAAVKAGIWAASAYIASPLCDREYVTRVFSKWIISNGANIVNKADSMFKISVEGDIAILINQIGDLWDTLTQTDKDVIWLWLDHFLSECTQQ